MSKITLELEKLIASVTAEINALSFEIERAEDRGLSVPAKVNARKKCQAMLDRLLKLKTQWEK